MTKKHRKVKKAGKVERIEKIETQAALDIIHPIVVLLFSAIFAIFACGLLFKNLTYSVERIPTLVRSWPSAYGGTVHSVSHYHRSGTTYDLTIQYKVADKTYEFQEKTNADVHTSAVRYDKEAPSHFYREQTQDERNAEMLSAAFCLIVGILGIWVWVRRPQARKATYNIPLNCFLGAVCALLAYSCFNGLVTPELQSSEVNAASPYKVARIL